jgi:hypothetical protein
MEIEVNNIAILLAAVVSMAIGFAWYSRALFGKQWMKLKGYTPDSLKKAQKEMGKWYTVSFVVALITAYVLAHIMVLSENFYHNSRVQTGFATAFWAWLGFVMPVQLTEEIFGEKKWKLFLINTGYQLASLVAMGIVLGVV